MKHRNEYVQKNIIVFKKKKKSDFEFSLFLPNFESHNSYLSHYEAFSTAFSNFFDFFDFHFFYPTFKSHNTSNEGNERGDSKHFDFRIAMRLCENVEMC